MTARRPKVGDGAGVPSLGSWAGPVAAALLRRPWLWPIAVRQVFTLAPNRWWRHRPWLPVPDPAYLHFRLVTQYGDGSQQPDPADVVHYLRWCRAFRATTRQR